MTVVFTVLTFSSCGEDESVGRSFIYPIEKDPKSLDPQICGDASTAIAVNSIYEGLVKLGENGEILPGVAETMSVSDDGLTYTFKLREDAKWHIIDKFEYVYGEDCHKNVTLPITAHDFVFAFHRIFSQVTNAPGAETLYAIKNSASVHAGTLIPERLGVVAQDDKTLIITLEAASADFLTLLAQPICMPCNKEFFEKTGGKYGLGLAYTMCNGTFYLSKWNETNLYLRKNVDYVGTTQVIPASLSLYFNNDKSGYARRVSDGTYDAAPIEKQYLSTLDESVTVKELANITWGFAFNCADEQTSDANLRIALCKAFDYETLETPEINRARGIIPPSCKIGGKNYRAEAGEAEFLAKGEVSARQYLQKALENLERSAATVTVICLKEHETSMRKVIQQWQKVFGVGINASLTVVDYRELQTALSKGSFQIAFAPLTATTTSAALNLHGFYTESASNIFKYSSAVYELLVDKIDTASTSAKAIEYCKKAESYLISDGVFYPLYEGKSYFAFNKDSVDITVTPAGDFICFASARKLS